MIRKTVGYIHDKQIEFYFMEVMTTVTEPFDKIEMIDNRYENLIQTVIFFYSATSMKAIELNIDLSKRFVENQVFHKDHGNVFGFNGGPFEISTGFKDWVLVSTDKVRIYPICGLYRTFDPSMKRCDLLAMSEQISIDIFSSKSSVETCYDQSNASEKLKWICLIDADPEWYFYLMIILNFFALLFLSILCYQYYKTRQEYKILFPDELELQLPD